MGIKIWNTDISKMYVYVYETIHVTGVTLDKNSISLTTVWQTEQLTATVTPANADDQAVTWSSSDTSVATVSNTWLVTCVTPWTCTITATTHDGGYTATCLVSQWWDMNNWTLLQTSSWLSWVWWGWVALNSDGTKLFLTGNGHMYEIPLSTAYDLTNLSFTKNTTLSWIEDIHFSPDGTKMFVLRAISSQLGVRRYDLSTAWDISTAVYTQSLTTGEQRWLFITNDWTKVFVSHHVNNTVELWNLSTPRDLSTADSWTTATSSYGWIWIWFSPDGKMFFTQNDENTTDLTYLTLSTPYDFSTITSTWTKNIWKCRAWWIWFNDNWTMCFMVGWWNSTNYVTKYIL